MDNDDLPVGRILSRREALALLGSAGAALLLAACTTDEPEAASVSTSTVAPTSSGGVATTGTPGATAVATSSAVASGTTTAAALPACVVKPELTLGPFFVDEQLNRSDIRPDPVTGQVSGGVPLDLTFRVSQVAGGACAFLEGAVVDVWQCDADGVYSDVTGNTQKFLRGFQVTDANGVARFTTVYPGWYRGRTVHIHFKVVATRTNGASEEFVSQLFFDDALTDSVFQQAPYNTRTNRTTRNAQDGIFRESGGVLTLEPVQTASGYAATFEIGMQA